MLLSLLVNKRVVIDGMPTEHRHTTFLVVPDRGI
jgi:hypothetical protein